SGFPWTLLWTLDRRVRRAGATPQRSRSRRSIGVAATWGFAVSFVYAEGSALDLQARPDWRAACMLTQRLLPIVTVFLFASCVHHSPGASDGIPSPVEEAAMKGAGIDPRDGAGAATVDTTAHAASHAGAAVT